MSSKEQTLVAVHRDGNSRNLAEVYASALQDVRRADAGDVSDAVLHAYVTPADFVHGAPSVAPGSDTRILVCVRRRYNTKAAYAALLDLVDRSTASMQCSLLL